MKYIVGTEIHILTSGTGGTQGFRSSAFSYYMYNTCWLDQNTLRTLPLGGGGREGGKEGGRVEGRKGGRRGTEGWMREGGRKGRKERGGEGWMEEGGRKGGREAPPPSFPPLSQPSSLPPFSLNWKEMPTSRP